MMNKGDAKVKKDNKLVKYLKGTKSELKKIVWPSFKQVVKNTLVVLIFVAIIALVIAALDLLFSNVLIKLIIK